MAKEILIDEEVLTKIRNYVTYRSALPPENDTKEWYLAEMEADKKAQEGQTLLLTVGRILMESIAPDLPIGRRVKLILTIGD